MEKYHKDWEVDEEIKARLIEHTDLEEQKETESQSFSKHVTIYLLANPRSGSQEGATYTNLRERLHTFKLNTGGTASLHIVNITYADEINEFK